MFRRDKVKQSSKLTGMVSMVQKGIINIWENDNGVCVWTTEYIVSYTEYR